MTELLYQKDSYLKDFDANIVKVDRDNCALLLDKTAFFPGGGGQPYDTGVIQINNEGLNISRVKKSPDGIWHFYDDGMNEIHEGMSIHGTVDWERRYKTMRTHTAMHILCGVIFRDYGALVTGGDMEPLKGRMDFEFETMTADLVKVIEESVNKEVNAGHDVKVAILPREEAFKIPDLIRTKINLLPSEIKEIRTIEIVGLDLQADGGTHVGNTREVGTMRITDYKSKGKINKRIYIELAE